MTGKPTTSPSLIRASQQTRKPGTRVVIGPESPRDDHQIKVHQSNGIVESIEVRCKCGEIIKIHCQYSQQANA